MSSFDCRLTSECQAQQPKSLRNGRSKLRGVTNSCPGHLPKRSLEPRSTCSGEADAARLQRVCGLGRDRRGDRLAVRAANIIRERGHIVRTTIPHAGRVIAAPGHRLAVPGTKAKAAACQGVLPREKTISACRCQEAPWHPSECGASKL